MINDYLLDVEQQIISKPWKYLEKNVRLCKHGMTIQKQNSNGQSRIFNECEFVLKKNNKIDNVQFL